MARAVKNDTPRVESDVGESAPQLLIVCDHPIARCGLLAILADEPGLRVCGEAATLDDALSAVAHHDPDFLILDVSYKNGQGVYLVQQCRQQSERLRILVLSSHEEWLYAGRMLQAGAMAYLSRNATPSMVVDALRKIMSGEIYLSPEVSQQLLADGVNGTHGSFAHPMSRLTDRELQVFELIGQGKTTRAMARTLKLSAHTIETYRERIRTKLNITSGADLTFRAILWVLLHS
jgi:DNA-binding NarL/FixJ family response regulator